MTPPTTENSPARRSTVFLLATAAVIGWGWALAQHYRPKEPETAAASPAPQRVASKPRAASEEHPQKETRPQREVSTKAEGFSGTPNAAVRDALSSTDRLTRLGKFLALLDRMKPEDAPAFHEAICARIKEGGHPHEEYQMFLSRWAALDGKGALDYFANGDPTGVNAFRYESLISGWASADPQAAVRWLSDQKNPALGGHAWNALFQGWLSTDPEGAESWLFSGTPPPTANMCLAMATAARLERSNPEATAEWLAAVPLKEESTSSARSAWGEILRASSFLKPEEAAAVWTKVADAPWCRAEDFLSFLQLGARDPKNADAFYAKVSEKWPAQKVTATFRKWTAASPEPTRTWLERAPDCELVRAARAGAAAAGENPH